jgi:hypothetical protein
VSGQALRAIVLATLLAWGPTGGAADCWGNNHDGQLGRRPTIFAPKTVRAGSHADVTGHLRSMDPVCIGLQRVTLRVLRPTSVADRSVIAAADGDHAFTVRVKREIAVRVVFADAGGCERVRSARRSVAAV